MDTEGAYNGFAEGGAYAVLMYLGGWVFGAFSFRTRLGKVGVGGGYAGSAYGFRDLGGSDIAGRGDILFALETVGSFQFLGAAAVIVV